MMGDRCGGVFKWNTPWFEGLCYLRFWGFVGAVDEIPICIIALRVMVISPTPSIIIMEYAFSLSCPMIAGELAPPL